MKSQGGFTLIELMIVIATIAILAALAIPQYNDYTARTQLSEAIVLMGGLKIPIGEQFANANDASSCAIPSTAVKQGKYVASITAAAAAPCVVTARMKSAGVNGKVASATVVITYASATGIWDCSTSAPSEIAPKGCPHK